MNNNNIEDARGSQDAPDRSAARMRSIEYVSRAQLDAVAELLHIAPRDQETDDIAHAIATRIRRI